MRNPSAPGRKLVSAAEGYQSDPGRFKPTQLRRTLPGKFAPAACRTIDTFLKVWFSSHPEIKVHPATKPPPKLLSKQTIVARFAVSISIWVQRFVGFQHVGWHSCPTAFLRPTAFPRSAGFRRARMPILPELQALTPQWSVLWRESMGDSYLERGLRFRT